MIVRFDIRPDPTGWTVYDQTTVAVKRGGLKIKGGHLGIGHPDALGVGATVGLRDWPNASNA